MHPLHWTHVFLSWGAVASSERYDGTVGKKGFVAKVQLVEMYCRGREVR